MKLISVIVPVYKVEAYLRQCLDSILASTYSNLEVIVVDDGSPDECPRICDEYAEKDARVQVIHQENQGLVAARNAGLGVARGEYIGFVDSDDMVSQYFYESLINAMVSTDSDVAFCECTQSEDKLQKSGYVVMESYTTFDTFEEQLSVLVRAPSVRKKTWTSSHVINKLYRKEKITRLFNKHCLMCEDLQFNWDYIMEHSCKMVLVPEMLYYYRQNNQSIMGQYYAHVANMKGPIALVNTWRAIAENSPVSEKLRSYLYARVVYLMHGALIRYQFAEKGNVDKAVVSDMRSYMRKHGCDLFRQTDTYGKKMFVSVWLCCNGHAFWKCAVKRIYGRNLSRR